MKGRDISFREVVQGICAKDPRYDADAYLFLMEALDSTVKAIREKEPEHGRDVSGRELLEGIRAFALDEYGPLAYTVFAEWGIHETADFGAIVFNLVEAGRLGKTESDSLEDFNQVYDFDEAFRLPFEPQEPPEKDGAAGKRQRG